MEQLKQCPFCGGQARFWYGMQQFGVECTNCSAMIKADSYTAEEAAEEWNRRVDDGDTDSV